MSSTMRISTSPTVSALVAGNISQLADACDAGAAARCQCLDDKPQGPRSGPEEVAANTRRRAPPGKKPPMEQIQVGNQPRISSPQQAPDACLPRSQGDQHV